MKTIYLVRHAKSSWEDMSLRDIDRPLNKRGLRDAPFMANLLKGKGAKPQAIVSSPANRAFTTAGYFAKAFDIPADDIIVKPEIYEAFSADIFKVIHELPENLNTICLFGHNPTFTNVANLFAKTDYIPNVPTCGICRIDSKAQQWTEFDPANSSLTEFHYPKQYFS